VHATLTFACGSTCPFRSNRRRPETIPAFRRPSVCQREGCKSSRHADSFIPNPLGKEVMGTGGPTGLAGGAWGAYYSSEETGEGRLVARGG